MLPKSIPFEALKRFLNASKCFKPATRLGHLACPKHNKKVGTLDKGLAGQQNLHMIVLS